VRWRDGKMEFDNVVDWFQYPELLPSGMNCHN
jgi:hypothetical protein